MSFILWEPDLRAVRDQRRAYYSEIQLFFREQQSYITESAPLQQNQ